MAEGLLQFQDSGLPMFGPAGGVEQGQFTAGIPLRCRCVCRCKMFINLMSAALWWGALNPRQIKSCKFRNLPSAKR